MLCTHEMCTSSTSKELVPQDFVLELDQTLKEFIWKIIMVSACINQVPQRNKKKMYI